MIKIGGFEGERTKGNIVNSTKLNDMKECQNRLNKLP